MLFDLPSEQDNKSKLPTLKIRLYLADLNDVDLDNFPQAVNATISTNVLLPGKTWKFIDALTNTMNPLANPGESPYTGNLTLTPALEGVSKRTLNWVYENVGRRVIAVWERCSDGQKFIGGGPCSGGLQITYTNIGTLDAGSSGIALQLLGGDCPEPFWFYDGLIAREDPVTINLGAETSFALQSSSLYLLADNAAAKTLTDITAVTDADVGRIIELVGGGVNFPTQITPSSTFILQNGIAFEAKVGNKISFLIAKTGTNSYAFYEVLRG